MFTRNAMSLAAEDIKAGLVRHRSGDWGNLDIDAARMNFRALEYGGTISSAYRAADGTEFWIVTEADRSVTTVMLPEDH
jgi:hypothetical protein